MSSLEAAWQMGQEKMTEAMEGPPPEPELCARWVLAANGDVRAPDPSG